MDGKTHTTKEVITFVMEHLKKNMNATPEEMVRELTARLGEVTIVEKPRCSAITKKGTRCKLTAKRGECLCHVHMRVSMTMQVLDVGNKRAKPT